MARRPAPRAAKRLAVPTVQPADGSARTRSALDALAGIDRLDTSRSYGRVTGDFMVNGARVAYEQKVRGGGSRLYDHEHRRIYRPGEREAAAAAAAAAAPPPRVREVASRPAPPPPPELASDDDFEEEPPPMVLPSSPTEAVAGDDNDVNLTAWAERVVTYRWAAVRDAIEERYGRVVNDEAEARDFLLDEGIGKGSGRKAEAHGG